MAKSDIHFFETAKLNDPWQAKWIGVAGDDTQRITGDVGEAGALQGIVHVDCFFGAAGFGNGAYSQHRSRERILHAVWFHNRIKDVRNLMQPV